MKDIHYAIFHLKSAYQGKSGEYGGSALAQKSHAKTGGPYSAPLILYMHDSLFLHILLNAIGFSASCREFRLDCISPSTYSAHPYYSIANPTFSLGIRTVYSQANASAEVSGTREENRLIRLVALW